MRYAEHKRGTRTRGQPALGTTNRPLGNDGTASLNTLLKQAAEAVPSVLALSVFMARYGLPLALTAWHQLPGGHAVKASLALRLSDLTRDPHGDESVLVLYASEPGVFDSMAAELSSRPEVGPARVVVDDHLELPDREQAARAAEEWRKDVSAIDQAVGVLLDRFLLPEDALKELVRLADDAGASVLDQARVLLKAVQDSR